MNLRDFCKERDYEIFIGTTYSFDPLFFERIIFRDIKLSNAREVLILGDNKQLIDSIIRCRTQLKKVGNALVADTIHIRGAFHPKILLKIGKKGAKLLLGSGNMTAGGWGTNNELFSEWILGPDDPYSGFIINYIIKSLKFYSTNELSIKILNRSLEYNWIINNNKKKLDREMIITEPNSSLSKTLIKKWGNKQFHTLKIYTGSTDSSGAFIEWCHKNFGIKECIIAANEYNLSFNPDEIKKLPINISFAILDDNKMMHAKAYIFEGDNEICAITGSANCSRKAWLMSPEKGGNVEAILLHDNLHKDDLNELLSKFPKDYSNIDDVKLNHKQENINNENDNILFRINNISLDRFRGELRLEFKDKIPKDHTIEIILDDSIYILQPLEHNYSLWITKLDDLTHSNRDTLFIEIIIKEFDAIISKFEYWVNDIDTIRSLANSNKITGSFRAYLDSESNSDYNKALKEFKLIGSIILDDPKSFQDPNYSINNKEENKQKSATDNMDPIELDSFYKSMSEINLDKYHNHVNGGEINNTLSLSGIMKLFFSFQDEIHHNEHDLDEENIKESDNKEETPKKEKSKEFITKTVNDRFKKKIENQIEDYFIQLHREEFRNHCTISQLMQATAYPLAITVFGLNNGWINNSLAEKWIMNIIDILFTMIIDEHEGILNFIKNRYIDDGNIEIFNQVCGDGILWIALLTTIERIDWNKKNGFINKAYSIVSIINYKSLLSSTNSGRISLLIKNHKFKQTAEWIKSKPIKIFKLLTAIEDRLIEKFDNYTNKQLNDEHLIDDILYSKDLKWAIVHDDRKSIYSSTSVKIYIHKRGRVVKCKTQGYFINLRLAAYNDNKLKELISQLRIL
tara:strand:+ start:1461 stop:4031 length:2571 start_codon:yes stop_codon:yes gene_type:complete